MTDRRFPGTDARRAFQKGFDAKAEEITGMGLAAARDKFAADYPAPYRFPADASEGAVWFSKGEHSALMSYLGSRYDNTEPLPTNGN